MMDNSFAGWALPTILVRNDTNGGRRPPYRSTPPPPVLILSVIVVLAVSGAHAMAGPANDDCTQAEAITGEGMFACDNAAATTDGPAHEACSFGFGSDIGSDV